MLDDGTTVDAYDLPVRKRLSDDAHRLCVKVGLVVGRYQYRTVDDQIVGIGGRQAIAGCRVVDGSW